MLQPTRLISTPFAQEGEKTEIQNVTGEFDNSATYQLGFPPLTMQSIHSGGKPPKGTDFNGVLFDITENISFLCKGGRYQYNAGLSTLIGGYPEGSNLLLDDNVTEVVSTVAGNQNNPNTDMTGWILKPNRTTAKYVLDAGGETQQQVNYNGGSKWHSRVGGYLKNERVVLTNGDIVKSTIDGNTADPNVDMTGWVKKTNSASQIFDESGVSQQEINNRLSQLVITPEHFGAVAGEADSSTTLNAAIVFCSANNYVLDGRGKTYNANSLVLKDNTHIKRININSNLFDTMNSVITTDYGMLAPLKNITLDTVYINGKRELHTNVTPQMDGGRCAVLIRRPIDGLRIINSKLNNSVTDGLMLFPVDFAINESEWFSFVKNVQVINTDLQWNGRWGCSADSVDGLLFDNVRSKFNGLDVAGGGDYTTGKSARLMNGNHYGGAIDVEEYHGFSHSKNITLRGGDYTQNAAASLLMQRTGAITEANRNITLDNLQMDFGSINEAYPNKSMIIGGYSTTNTELSYRNLVIKNCNFGNGIAEFIGCDTTYLSELFDINETILTDSVVNTDKHYNFTLSDSYSNFYDVGYARKDKTAYFVGRNNEETTVNFYNENTIGKSVSLNIFDNGTVVSGLRFTKQDEGCDMHFLNGANPILTVRKYGSIIPIVDNIAQVGESSHRFSKLFGYSMSLSNLSVFSGNAAAKTGGLVVGDFYRTSTGQVMVVF